MWKKLGLGAAMLLALCGVSIEGLAIDEPTSATQNSNSTMTAVNSNSGANVNKKKATGRRRPRGRRGR